jgi:hypothetical protein
MRLQKRVAGVNYFFLRLALPIVAGPPWIDSNASLLKFHFFDVVED